MLKEQQEAPVGKFSSDEVRILAARLLDEFHLISADVGAGGPDVLEDHGPMSERPRSRRFCCGLPEPPCLFTAGPNTSEASCPALIMIYETHVGRQHSCPAQRLKSAATGER